MAQLIQKQKHYNGLRLIKNEKQALRKRGRRVPHKQQRREEEECRRIKFRIGLTISGSGGKQAVGSQLIGRRVLVVVVRGINVSSQLQYPIFKATQINQNRDVRHYERLPLYSMPRNCGHQIFQKYALLRSDLGPTTITSEAMKQSLQTGASVDNADDTAAESLSICIFSSTELIKKKNWSPNIVAISQFL